MKDDPDFKFESSTNFEFSESTFKLYDGDSVIYSTFRSQQAISHADQYVKSVGKHFGVGGFFGIQKNEIANLDLQISTGPAIEYNIFDYDRAATSQLRFAYGIFYQYSDYTQMTIYDKMIDKYFVEKAKILLQPVDKMDLLEVETNSFSDFF